MKAHISIRLVITLLRTLQLVVGIVIPQLLFGQDPVANVKARAERNDAYAQSLYGYWLLHNNEGNHDTAEAVRWIVRSAEAKHPCGEHLLAVLYRKGIGVERDERRAATLDSMALLGIEAIGEEGNAWVQMLLGNMYRDGDGTPVNVDRAIRWFTAAAEQDIVSAQFSLARLLHAEHRSDEEAVRWLHRAAQHGHAPAQYFYALACYLGRGTAKNADEGLIWLTSSAKKGYAPASEMLAMLNQH